MLIKKNKLFSRSSPVLITAILQLSALSPAHAENAFTIKNGELQRPTGYREWIYVGTPVTPNEMNNGKALFPEHHNIYIAPESWKHWKDQGEFPDRTIIIQA